MQFKYDRDDAILAQAKAHRDGLYALVKANPWLVAEIADWAWQIDCDCSHESVGRILDDALFETAAPSVSCRVSGALGLPYVDVIATRAPFDIEQDPPEAEAAAITFAVARP